MARTPLFLERRRYRYQRMMDAVRLLPLLGLFLWMLPLMWPVPEEGAEGIGAARALTYVFGVWAVMILASVLLWWRTRTADRAQGDAD